MKSPTSARHVFRTLSILKPYGALFLVLLSILEAYLISRVGVVTGQFYEIFIDRRAQGFRRALLTSSALYLLTVVIRATKTYLIEYFALCWRDMLTSQLQEGYMLSGAFYWLATIDNPDQRIAQDLPQLCNVLSQVLAKVVAAPFSVIWYTWCVQQTFGTWTPVLVAYIFFAGGSLLQRMVVGPTSALVFTQEKLEGDFRFRHMRVRQWKEAVAFYRASETELHHLFEGQSAVLANQWRLVLWHWLLASTTYLLEYSGAILNYGCVAMVVFQGTWRDEDAGSLAKKFSFGSFYLLTLIYSFTELLDLGKMLADLLGFNARVVELMGAIQKGQGSGGTLGSRAPGSCKPSQAGSQSMKSRWANGMRGNPSTSTLNLKSDRQSPPGRPLLGTLVSLWHNPSRGYQRLGWEEGSGEEVLVEYEGRQEAVRAQHLQQMSPRDGPSHERHASQAVLLQPPSPLVTTNGFPLEFSIHSLGTDVLLAEIHRVFPDAAQSKGILAVVTFQFVNGENLTMESSHREGSPGGYPCRLPGPEEMAQPLAVFLDWQQQVREKLTGAGYWCDCIDPRSGFALHGTRGEQYNEVIGAEVLLGYMRHSQAPCPLISHPLGGLQVYPSSLFTTAPLPQLRAAISSTGQVKPVSSHGAVLSQTLVKLQDFSCCTPCGAKIVDHLQLQLLAGGSLLITGPSGCGKTSLLRCLAGLWPHKHGTIALPPDSDVMFLPQTGLVAPGPSLYHQLVYPRLLVDDCHMAQGSCREQVEVSGSGHDGHLLDILDRVGLTYLMAQHQVGLHDPHPWGSTLSPGEVQRLSLGRVLLHRPRVVLLDEATSALAADVEEQLYREVLSTGATVVSVGHRTGLRALHQQELTILGAGTWKLQPCQRLLVVELNGHSGYL